MPKIIVRDDVAPAVVYNEHTASYVAVFAGKAFEVDDPFVADHRDLFDRGVEQMTAAPGQKRNTRRSNADD